jgi:hypothetical protein
VIAATNVDLEAEVAAGRFRADLFYRIHVVAIEVPPLRARVADVPLLAEQFLGASRAATGATCARSPRRALQRLCAHPWPGNVRELENALERAVLVARGARLEPRDLFPEDARADPALAGRNRAGLRGLAGGPARGAQAAPGRPGTLADPARARAPFGQPFGRRAQRWASIARRSSTRCASTVSYPSRSCLVSRARCPRCSARVPTGPGEPLRGVPPRRARDASRRAPPPPR